MLPSPPVPLLLLAAVLYDCGVGMEVQQRPQCVFPAGTPASTGGAGSGAASDSGSPSSPISDTSTSATYNMAAASLLQGRPIGGPYAGLGLATPGLSTLSPPDMTPFTALQPSALNAAAAVSAAYMFSPQSMAAAAAAMAGGGKLASPPATALSQPASKPPVQSSFHATSITGQQRAYTTHTHLPISLAGLGNVSLGGSL
jgi:hypothetical protein